MKTNAKILALLLAVITVLSAFAACGEVAETTLAEDETDPVIVDDTTVGSVDTEADETEPADTLPVVAEPEIDFTLLKLDFETDLSVADYIAATEGIAINETLNGGEIKDGKWVYSGKPLAIRTRWASIPATTIALSLISASTALLTRTVLLFSRSLQMTTECLTAKRPASTSPLRWI